MPYLTLFLQGFTIVTAYTCEMALKDFHGGTDDGLQLRQCPGILQELLRDVQ
jgi:hypothetical protein